MKTMKQTGRIALTLVITLALLALLPIASPRAQAGESVTLTGEVIGSACYIRHGARGDGHRPCARECADAGIPLALLEDGTEDVIWLTAGDHGSANDQVERYAGQTVEITGILSQRGGAKLLAVEKVEPVS